MIVREKRKAKVVNTNNIVVKNYVIQSIRYLETFTIPTYCWIDMCVEFRNNFSVRYNTVTLDHIEYVCSYKLVYRNNEL